MELLRKRSSKMLTSPCTPPRGSLRRRLSFSSQPRAIPRGLQTSHRGGAPNICLGPKRERVRRGYSRPTALLRKNRAIMSGRVTYVAPHAPRRFRHATCLRISCRFDRSAHLGGWRHFVRRPCRFRADLALGTEGRLVHRRLCRRGHAAFSRTALSALRWRSERGACLWRL